MADKRFNQKSATKNASDYQKESLNRSGGSPGGEWYEVRFSIPWIVKKVDSGQDAINIAVSEVGKRITPAKDPIREIDISVQQIRCADCETSTDALLMVSKTGLVGLLLTMEAKGTTYEEAITVAKREIGPKLPEIPLTAVRDQAKT